MSLSVAWKLADFHVNSGRSLCFNVSTCSRADACSFSQHSASMSWTRSPLTGCKHTFRQLFCPAHDEGLVIHGLAGACAVWAFMYTQYHEKRNTSMRLSEKEATICLSSGKGWLSVAAT